jgi:serine/threonine protein phosphatase PrpC/ribosomal protein L39E
MTENLRVTIGQHSTAGRKAVNQDFHGALIPRGPLLAAKGVAVALADGISTSKVSAEASESAVRSFLEDYYCTSDAWGVKRSAQRVISATNSWLHTQSQQGPDRFEKDRGYVCTFSAMVIKSNTAHLFHVGDSRIYRVHAHALEQLTEDHRIHISSEQSYLARAMGVGTSIDIDYRSFGLTTGEVYLLATDGVSDHVDAEVVRQAIDRHDQDLDEAARAITQAAFERGSLDNLTAQLVRIEALPAHALDELTGQRNTLALPPVLEARALFDRYQIVRELHASSRSHIYLAIDVETGQQVALKTPSTDLREDPAHLERFHLEEWIARRIDSPHVLKARSPERARQFLYVVMEYIEGQTLTQWMLDHPAPELATVRALIAQLAKGLQAFHRMDMLHQDLRPANIMIDATGTVKIIDFGSTRVAGLSELKGPHGEDPLLGTAQYMAPEYFLGASGTPRSDLFSLGVIAYQMLTGQLPYGAGIARTRTPAEQRKLVYGAPMRDNRPLPAWVAGALRKAVHIDPLKRHEDVAEFAYDLHHPNREFLQRSSPPLVERNPVALWQGVSLILLLALLVSLAFHR